MKGNAIPSLRLEVLNRLIDEMLPGPELIFTNMFPSTSYPSDTIEWEVWEDSAGMTPFVAPGSPAPSVGIDTTRSGRATAAYWKEKTFFDEVFLNNMRMPGSHQELLTKERQVARQLARLNYRAQRRKEYMFAKMLTDGTMTYQINGGAKFTVNWGIPTANQETLVANRYWGTGSTRNPVEDLFDIKLALKKEGVVPSMTYMNSTTLKLLLFDTSIQTLLAKSNYGEGDLFARPAPVLADLLGLGRLAVIDTLYEAVGWLTADVTASSTTTVYVEDASDFEAGGTLRFINMTKTPDQAGYYEDETISSVDKAANTITISAAPSVGFKAGRDKVIMKKSVVADYKVVMLDPSNYGGAPIAEFLEAPFGLARRWGRYVDTHDEWDPEGMYLRIQDKGMPVLYRPSAIFQLTVAA